MILIYLKSKREALYIIFSLGVLSLPLSAQHEFKQLRYDEHYDSYRDSSSLSWYEKTKFLPARSSKAYVSLGGEVRYQYFKFENEEWGDAPEDSDGYILNRLLFHADLHLGKRIRLFSQLQSSIAVGRIDPSPVELNELDLHQLFLDVELVTTASLSVVTRIGRQEFSYGSSRLISTREGPNNRQAFDGAKIILKSDRVKADAFYSEYVFSKTGIFNDEFFDDRVKFGGAYFVVTQIPIVGNLDAYYLYIEKQQTTWNDVSGKERRSSVGVRLSSKPARFHYDIEGLYQFGTMAENTIDAWTLSYNLSYVLGTKESAPSIGLKTELISGDAKQGDDKIQSFNPLFPRGAYFGYAALIGPSNLFDVHPSVDIPLSRSTSLSLDYDAFWRYSTNDGIYNPGTQVIYPAGDSNEKVIGHQISTTLEYTPNPFIYMRLETTWFKSGPYLKSVGSGKDIFYFGVTTTLRF